MPDLGTCCLFDDYQSWHLVETVFFLPHHGNMSISWLFCLAPNTSLLSWTWSDGNISISWYSIWYPKEYLAGFKVCNTWWLCTANQNTNTWTVWKDVSTTARATRYYAGKKSYISTKHKWTINKTLHNTQLTAGLYKTIRTHAQGNGKENDQFFRFVFSTCRPSP